MANEKSKDFNAMLRESKDMPKIQTITDEKSITKYGGEHMYFAPPMDYDKVMKTVPFVSVCQGPSYRISTLRFSCTHFGND